VSVRIAPRPARFLGLGAATKWLLLLLADLWSLGGVIVLLTWLYLSTLVLLFGAPVNTQI
jgi:uncharacterized BrkB/YihY/UPF0761 family membrane protein